MSSLNKVILMGRLGRDPEVRRLSDQQSVVTFSLATSESWRDKQTGERKEVTEWHQIAIFNEKLGEIAENYLKKGSLALVQGQIKTRKYEKDGVERYVTEIVLPRFGGELTLIDGGGRSDEPRSEAKAQTSKAAPKASSASSYDEDSIPF